MIEGKYASYLYSMVFSLCVSEFKVFLTHYITLQGPNCTWVPKRNIEMEAEEAYPHIPLGPSSPFARDGWVQTSFNSGTSLSNFDIVKGALQSISSLSNSTRIPSQRKYLPPSKREGHVTILRNIPCNFYLSQI